MSAERVRNYLMEHGVRYETHSHPAAYKASEIAEIEGVPGEDVAKVVMLVADGQPVMSVIPGNRMVDLDKASATLDSDEVRLADEPEFSPSFPDCEVGAEPPFGWLYDIPTIVDITMDSPRITFNAGSHTETITMALEDYLDLTGPRRGDLVTG